MKPLLEGDSARAAVESINQIAAALTARIKDPEQSALIKAELGEGAAGIALFFAYLQLAVKTPGQQSDSARAALLPPPAAAEDLSFEYLNLATAALAGRPMAPSLFAGFVGVAWSAQHITNLFSDSPTDLCADIDLALETYLNRSPWRYDYDLINGLVGIGVYCLEHKQSPVAIRCLELILERLSELAEKSEGGLRWLTSPDLLPENQRKTYPQGHYNLGLAHGVPGIIALLAQSYAAGIAPQRAGHLLEGAIHWLLRQRLPQSAASSFSAFVAPEQAPEDCRLAWCYGDAGLSAALLLAARCTRNRNWESEALSVARRAADRQPKDCGVVDACLCHGSAGLAHTFNRFYQATHDELFAHAARYWTEWTLNFRKPGTGAADYSFWTLGDSGKMDFQPRFGIIEGIAGIGLSLLAAVTDVPSDWDRVFMLNIPPWPAARP